jgi:YVTN family beta-propeller protein
MVSSKKTLPHFAGRRQKGGRAGIQRKDLIKGSIVLAFAAAAVIVLMPGRGRLFSVRAATFPGFPSSSPIALNSQGNLIWVVNPDPDNNSVTVIDVSADSGRVIAEIPVGQEPSSVALNADDSRAYVANTVSGTVSVVDTGSATIVSTINVGIEPTAICFTPNYSKLYVACSSSNNVYVIDPGSNQVTKVIESAAFNHPFAITITNNGDSNDSDEVVYVTNLLADYVRGQAPRPADDLGKEGVVCVIDAGTDTFIDQVRLKPIKAAFQSDGRSQNADGAAVPAGTGTLSDTFAFPNLLTSIAGTRQGGANLIYTFATGSSPTGPVKFNVTVQSLVSEIRGVGDANQTANLNDQIKAETPAVINGVPKHRFATMPWGLAFFHNSFKAVGVASACDYVVVINFDQNGKATIAPNGANNIVRIFTGTQRDPNPDRSIFLDGKAPRGIVISQNDTRAYTFNYVSRDVTIMDLTTDQAVKTVATTQAKGDPTIQLGKELFNTAMGPIDSTNPNQGRMSNAGWCACVSCHINGLTDGVAWAFPSGPRVSVPLNWTFAPKLGLGTPVQRSLNWSAIFDELADFELNTRNVAGGIGLIQISGGAQDPNVKAFDPPSAGRDVRRDAITDYVQTIRSPISPVDPNDPDVSAGKKFFKKVGCADCHNSPLWTTSRVQFQPPPPAAEVVATQLKGQLVSVGTFDPTKPHEVIGTGATLNQTALGAAGFNVPSLLGAHASEKFLLHDGSVTSFDQLFDNPAHVGTNSKLSKQHVRDVIVKFLRSIDDRTQPL